MPLADNGFGDLAIFDVLEIEDEAREVSAVFPCVVMDRSGNGGSGESSTVFVD